MTLYDFLPSQTQPFSFQPTLDGSVYTVTATWNFFGQRYYLNIFSLSGVRIVTRALVGSTVAVKIASLSYAYGFVTVKTAQPHGYRIGATVPVEIVDAAPDIGVVTAFIADETTLMYSSADPGTITIPGSLQFNVNLAQGYFASSLIYRTANRQFEVRP